MKKTDEEKLQDITARFEALKAERDQFIDRWQEAEQYVAPSVYNWSDLDAIPKVPTRYESAPCRNAKTLEAGLTGYSISQNITWFKLTLQDQQLLEEYGVKDWLEEVETIIQAEFIRSNLYSESGHFVGNSIIDGHSVMNIEDDMNRQKLRFTTMRNNEMYLDVDDYGEVDTVFREYLMTIRNAVKFFGLENLDESIQEKYKESKHWNEKIRILYAVYPREDYDPDLKDNQNMPYAAVYVDLEHKKIIQESGYNELPYAVFYWDKISGIAYSNSPAISAMPDIKALNIIRSTSLKIAQTSAEPPMVVSSSIRTVNIVPRGRTYVDDPARDTIQPIKTGENYPITLQVKEDYAQNVKDWFFVDFFLMLQQKQGQMTATEVMELQGEKAATLANLVVALNESLTKIIKRSFNILAKANKLPPPPESLEGTGAAMKVEFVGPLAQAQQKYHAMGGINSAIGMIGAIGQMFPNAMDNVDGDQIMKSALTGLGVPQKTIREQRDVEELRKARIEAEQAQMQQAQQQAMAQSLMQNANKLNQAPQKGSPLADLNEQLRGGVYGGAL
ncbi:portal protein [Treponema sp.]|uniref:portal protein n=1 Tax=Treponema sp. TaxID=166 RepID=UPI00298D8299|nr:portal protein [Treponema sp.]MCQ2242099.1 portal protein [Treponema sp.]